VSIVSPRTYPISSPYDHLADPLLGVPERLDRRLDLLGGDAGLDAFATALRVMAGPKLPQLRLEHGDLCLERGIPRQHQRLVPLDQLVGPSQNLEHEPVHLGANLGAFGWPDDAFGSRSGGKRHQQGQHGHSQRDGPGDRQRLGPLARQTRTRQQEGDLAQHRHHQLHRDRGQCQEDPHDEEAICHEDDDPDQDHDPVEEGGHSVADEPAGLAARRGGASGALQAAHVAQRQARQLLPRPGGQVGDLDQVREDVVAVEAQQGISVEDEG